MRNSALAAILSLVLFCIPVYSKDSPPPNLSGSWKLNLPKSKPPKRYKIQSQSIVISCSGLDVRFVYDTDGRQSVESYVADGKERVIPGAQPQNGVTSTKAEWRKDILIVDLIRKLPVSGSSLTEVWHFTGRWQISSDGLTLTDRLTDNSQISDEGTGVLVYDKQASTPVGSRTGPVAKWTPMAIEAV
jgi:hypothetical protein